MNFEGARYHRCKGTLKENCLLYYTCKNRRLSEMQRKYNRGCDGVVKFRVIFADGEFKANVDHLVEFRPHDDFCEFFPTNDRLRMVCDNELGKEKSRQGQKPKRIRDQQLGRPGEAGASSGANPQEFRNLSMRPPIRYRPKINDRPRTDDRPRAPDRPKVPSRPRPSGNQLFANNFKINRVVFVSGSDESDDESYPKNNRFKSTSDKSSKPYVTPVYEIVQEGDEEAPVNFYSKLTGDSAYAPTTQISNSQARRQADTLEPMDGEAMDDESSSFSDELSDAFDQADRSFGSSNPTKRPPTLHRAELTYELPNQTELLYDSFSKRPRPINPIPPEKRSKRSSSRNEPPQSGELIKHKSFDLVQKEDGSIVVYA